MDGTLVDTNYHHAEAWFWALQRFDITVPIWLVHRHLGMGGDQLVTAVCDEETEVSCTRPAWRADCALGGDRLWRPDAGRCSPMWPDAARCGPTKAARCS